MLNVAISLVKSVVLVGAGIYIDQTLEIPKLTNLIKSNLHRIGYQDKVYHYLSKIG